MRFVRQVGIAAVVASVIATPARGQAPMAQAPAAQLPTVQQVFEHFATAVGGREAWAKVQGRSDKGTANITFAGLTGAYERHTGAPNKMRMIIDLGMAKLDQGFDGTVGWAVQPMGAATRMPPDQEKSLAETVQVGAEFLDAGRFVRASVDARESFDGVDCYKLSITAKSGEVRTEYFEVATGLRRGVITKSPMGDQKATLHDYKAFEGKLIPTTVTQSTPQGDVVLTTTAVVFTLPDPALFKAPEGISK